MDEHSEPGSQLDGKVNAVNGAPGLDQDCRFAAIAHGHHDDRGGSQGRGGVGRPDLIRRPGR